MKVVVEEDYLVADSLDSSNYVNERVSLCKIQSNKVCVYCDRVRVSKTWGSEDSYQRRFHKVFSQLCSLRSCCEQKQI